MSPSPLHERLLTAAGERTYRAIAEATSTHPETVRRYMQGHPPSAEFLASFCSVFGISGDWLLTGRGPMRARDVRRAILAEAGAPDLLSAVAASIEQVIQRLDRLEFYVQGLDARQRARVENGSNGQAAHVVSGRVRRIAEAVAQRPPPDAG